MSHSESNGFVVWLLFVSVIVTVTCFPTGKPERGPEADVNVEKHLPNGTIIGKYSYTDNDGNPIQVKYYADNSSYGVELKSFKVMDSTGNPVEYSKDMYKDCTKSAEPSSTGHKNKLSRLQMEALDSVPDEKDNIPYEIFNKRNNINRYKVPKQDSDFEVFYQGELNAPEKCGKEKVRVYFDKDRKIRNTQERKIRSALDHIDANKFCAQF